MSDYLNIVVRIPTLIIQINQPYIAFSISPKMITFICYQFTNGTYNSKGLEEEIDTTYEIMKIK